MSGSGSFQIARILGIPVLINVSWLFTLVFVTTILALRVYPAFIPPESPYRDDFLLHWVMALASGMTFFASIILHELAHSVMAQRIGIEVKNITLFIFGGVSQITSEARRPLHEFAIAIVGPLTSLLLSGLFFLLWWLLTGLSVRTPLSIVLEWLFVMNLVLAVFNMAPGFPMDGGRVLRSLLWGVSGNLLKATRLATFVGRGLGYGLMLLGLLSVIRIFSFLDPWSGVWFGILGMFLESSARQSYIQARALDKLSQVHAGDLMDEELETAQTWEQVRYLKSRGEGRRFILLIAGPDDKVVGVLTEKEAAKAPLGVLTTTAEDVMIRSENVATATPAEDGASMLQRMEAAGTWHLPVVSEGRVVGVVSKESLLRVLSRDFIQRPRFARQR